MNTPQTHPEYTFTTLADILAVVTSENAENLGKDLTNWLLMAAHTKALLGAVAGAEIPLEMQSFAWVDDGKNDMSVTISGPAEAGEAGQSITINVTTNPAPTPLEMAQEIVAAHKAAAVAPYNLSVACSEAKAAQIPFSQSPAVLAARAACHDAENRLDDALCNALSVATAYVSLHARNLELAAEVLPIETKRDAEIKALREQLAERDRQFYTPILDAAYAMNPARLQVCRMWVITARAAHRSDPTNTHAASYAAHVPDLLQTINTQAAENKALRERVEALEAAVCPKCAIEALLPTAPRGEGEGDA